MSVAVPNTRNGAPAMGPISTYCEFWPYRFGRRPGSVKDQRFVTPVCMPPAEADLELSDAELTALMTPLPAGRPGQSLHVSLGAHAMSHSKPRNGQPRYEFTLPRSFIPADYLPLRLATRADDARWLMSTIVRKTAHKAVDPWGCVRLHTDVMRRVMGPNTIAAIVKALEVGGAIETAPYYAGVKAKGYRLAKRFLGDRCARVPATDPRLIDRIEAERLRQQQGEQRNRWKPIHFMLDDEQRHVTVTADANEILDGLPEHTRLCQDVLLANIRRRQYPMSVSTTGRVFNSITGIKRELRPTLRLDGARLGSVDIRCAQPALLAMMLRTNSPPSGLKPRETYKQTPPVVPALLPVPCPALLPVPCLALLPASDVSAFAALASDGLLYESLMADTGLDRDILKLAVLRDVLAKRGRYPSVVENAFRNAFPTVYRIIRAVNRDDHGTLIRLLQRAESWLVIEQVAPRLLGQMPIMTLHDAIFSRRRDVREVEAGFREVFGELGFEMGLKVEN